MNRECLFLLYATDDNVDIIKATIKGFSVGLSRRDCQYLHIISDGVSQQTHELIDNFVISNTCDVNLKYSRWVDPIGFDMCKLYADQEVEKKGFSGEVCWLND